MLNLDQWSCIEKRHPNRKKKNYNPSYLKEEPCISIDQDLDSNYGIHE